MRITRKTSITVETKRKFTVRQESKLQNIYCPQCGGMMISAAVVADFFDLENRTIYKYIESKQIHFLETSINEMYICPRSFKEILRNILSCKSPNNESN